MIATQTIRVLCVEDEPLAVEGLRSVLVSTGDMTLVTSLTSADEVVVEALRLRPEIVILDVESGGRDAFEAAVDLHHQCPGVKVVLMSGSVHDQYVSQATRSHVAGYFSKRDPPQVVVDGLRRIVRGEQVFSPRVMQRCVPLRGHATSNGHNGDLSLTAVPTRLDTLTNREREVLRLIGQGLARAEIAHRLCRSPKTVDGHRERLMQKLDIHTTAELVRFAIREGLAEA